MSITSPVQYEGPMVAAQSRTLGAAIHGAGVFGPIPPLAIFLALRDDDPRATEHARLALNWQLTVAAATVAALIVQFLLSSLAFGAGAYPVVSVLAVLWLVPWAVGAVFAVMVGMRVLRRREARYPWSIPFISERAAERRRELLTVIGGDDDAEQPTPLAALALGFGLLGGLLGIPFGHLARARIRRTGEPGWSLATAGLAIGYAEVAITVTLTVVILLSLIVVQPFTG